MTGVRQHAGCDAPTGLRPISLHETRMPFWRLPVLILHGALGAAALGALPAAYASEAGVQVPSMTAEQGADGGCQPGADVAAPCGQLWLNPGFYAWHFQKDRHLNNRASGFGAEYRFSEMGAVTAGVYHNSNWSFSHYLGYYWRPLKWGAMRMGLIAGAVDGYPGTRKGGWFPAVLPTASVEYGRLGLNVFYIPSYKDSVNGSITFQLKIGIF